MADSDQLLRFSLLNTPVRGELVCLDSTFSDLVSRHHYPDEVAKLLGELAVCAALLSASLKFEGALTLQIVSQGRISALMAECRDNGAARGIARLSEAKDTGPWLHSSQLAITIEPDKGQRYQGVVPIDGANICDAVEGYFVRSEQIKTRLMVASCDTGCAGMLIQSLPQSASESSLQTDSDDWETAQALFQTLKAEELLELPNTTILHRLFNQMEVSVYPPTPLAFSCRCSDAASEEALRSLGQADALALLQERNGNIEIICEFCGEQRVFTDLDLQKIFDISRH